MKLIRSLANVTLVLASLTSWGIASTACDTSLRSGPINNPLVVCISNDGNIVSFASPARFTSREQFVPIEHIRVGVIGEGYALCDLNSTTRSFDAGFDESGWGAPSVSQPNGANTLPLIVVRTTLDGRFQLTQSFSVNTATKEVLIGMTVKNLTATTRQLALVRYADLDIDGTNGSDIFTRSFQSVFAQERNAVALTSPLTPSVGLSVTTAVEKKSDWSATVGSGTHTGCSTTSQVTPTAGQSGAPAAGDYVARIIIGFSLSSGQSRTVVLAYRRL